MIDSFLNKLEEIFHRKISNKMDESIKWMNQEDSMDILIIFKNININNSKEYRLDF